MTNKWIRWLFFTGKHIFELLGYDETDNLNRKLGVKTNALQYEGKSVIEHINIFIMYRNDAAYTRDWPTTLDDNRHWWIKSDKQMT